MNGNPDFFGKACNSGSLGRGTPRAAASNFGTDGYCRQKYGSSSIMRTSYLLQIA